MAIETADVALMGDDLGHLPDTFAHARRARIMAQNLALSGAILVSLVPLAAADILGLAAVVAVHELAEVVVIANGVRAGRRRSFRGTHAAAQGNEPTRQEAPMVKVAAAGACTDGCCGLDAPAETTAPVNGG